FAEEIIAFRDGEIIDRTIPGIQEALRGMAFIETTVKSSKAGMKWVAFPEI
ncbi:MAG: gfo/Idh/MocA family oxidoreductase, partial [Planctomycetia bacterium]|nr:gfo/Idh/MocA family oxidoreductase [Planctomycetia bacterium]